MNWPSLKKNTKTMSKPTGPRTTHMHVHTTGHWVHLWNTIQHRTVLIIFPLILQTFITLSYDL